MKHLNHLIQERLKLCSNNDLKNLLTERLKLNKDTKLSELYLIYPCDEDDNIVKNNKVYKTIHYWDEELECDYSIYIITTEQLNAIKNKISINKSTWGWKLPNNFDIDEFEKYYTNPKRSWWETKDLVKKIDRKYKLEKL